MSVAVLPVWRPMGFTCIENLNTGEEIVVDSSERRDWLVQALNMCEGVTADQLRELRDAKVTPVNILGAVAMQGVGATVVAISDRLAVRR